MCPNQYGVNHNVNQMSKSMITIDTFITSPFSNDGELMGIFLKLKSRNDEVFELRR